MHCDRCGRETTDVGIIPGPDGPSAVCVECQHPEDDPTLVNLRLLNGRMLSLTSNQESWHLTTSKRLESVESSVDRLTRATGRLERMETQREPWILWAGIALGIVGALIVRACTS